MSEISFVWWNCPNGREQSSYLHRMIYWTLFSFDSNLWWSAMNRLLFFVFYWFCCECLRVPILIFLFSNRIRIYWTNLIFMSFPSNRLWNAFSLVIKLQIYSTRTVKSFKRKMQCTVTVINPLDCAAAFKLQRTNKQTMKQEFRSKQKTLAEKLWKLPETAVKPHRRSACLRIPDTI